MIVNLEKRTFIMDGFKVRELEDGTQEIIAEGYASIFNSRTNIAGWYDEEIANGAFTESLSQGKDVRCLFNHNWDYVLGRVSAKTLTLEEDSKGLKFEVVLPNTTFSKDLQESMKRGDIKECSFGFVITGEDWDYSNEVPFVRITNVELYEISIVSLPQYEDTEASIRTKQIVKDIELRQKIQKRIGEFIHENA